MDWNLGETICNVSTTKHLRSENAVFKKPLQSPWIYYTEVISKVRSVRNWQYLLQSVTLADSLGSCVAA